MKLIYYLDKLVWSQMDLARHAGISAGTVQRVMKSEPITRRKAHEICAALSEALQSEIVPSDIDEIHVLPTTRSPSTVQELKRKHSHNLW